VKLSGPLSEVKLDEPSSEAKLSKTLSSEDK